MNTGIHTHTKASKQTNKQTNKQTQAVYLMFTNLTIMLSRGKTECIQTTYRDNRKYQQATAFNVTMNIFLTGM
jgi:hypothetical protein